MIASMRFPRTLHGNARFRGTALRGTEFRGRALRTGALRTASMLAVLFSAGPAMAFTQYIGVTTYTDNETLYPSVYCQRAGSDSTTLSFPYVDSNVEALGTTKFQSCDVSSYFQPHSDFNFNALSGATVVKSIPFTMDLYTKNWSSGPSIQSQTAEIFDYNGTKYILNYGVSDVPNPFDDSAYFYVGIDHSGWMGNLISSEKYADLKFGDLVLAGAHDAGMYVSSDPATATKNLAAICSSSIEKSNYPAFAFVCRMSNAGATALANTSLTQKDPIATMLMAGMRFFDVRPASPIGAKVTTENVTHIHAFIPGAPLADMVGDIVDFLAKNTNEIVILRVQSNGIINDQYSFISQTDLEDKFLIPTIQKVNSAQVNYQVVSDLGTLSDTTVADIVRSTKRLIVVYGGGVTAINDSYSDGAYQASIREPQYVLAAVSQAATTCSTAGADPSFQYTLLQLQNTASGALLGFYLQPEWAGDMSDALNDIASIDFSNILHSTKPWFDAATYPWLTGDGLPLIQKCNGAIVLLNDFADVAMGSYSVGLTKYRHDN